jgi:hypothetical protein
VQIPVQVDERDVFDFGTIYGGGPNGFTLLTYADPSTFTGADTNPLFDADDELVFMAKDAGVQSSAGSRPPGTTAVTGLELTLTNPLNASVAYVYLFESDGSLDAGAGLSYTTYDFNLLSGDYKTTYNTSSGPNPENSSVTTAAYSAHFSDRWIRNETAVFVGGATGVDLLDRHKNLFAPGNCARSENTFSAGEGAFIVNRSGPVRSIRGYVGANSGPTTYRLHRFYAEREDILTVLRVHPISGIVDFFDYSPNASGMNYRNNLSAEGIVIDGSPDVAARGALVWEMVTGAQGTLAMTHFVDTDIAALSPTNYHLDNSTPPVTQCTGDAFAYGSSGPWINQAIPNTDPYAGVHYHLETMRVIAYAGPNRDAIFAVACAAEAASPVAFEAAPYDPATGIAEHGTPDAAQIVGLSCWPNPASAVLHVRLTAARPGVFSVAVYDVAGRRVMRLAERSFGAGAHDLSYDVSSLPAGVFFVRARGPAGVGQTRRIVVLP